MLFFLITDFYYRAFLKLDGSTAFEDINAYYLALALLAGEAGMKKALFDAPYMHAMAKDEQIREIMKKIEVEVDADLAREWPNKWPARVAVHCADGRRSNQLIEYPLGEPEHPLPYSQLVEKFKRASQGYLRSSEADRAIEIIEQLEKPGSIANLLPLVSGEKSGGATL